MRRLVASLALLCLLWPMAAQARFGGGGSFSSGRSSYSSSRSSYSGGSSSHYTYHPSSGSSSSHGYSGGGGYVTSSGGGSDDGAGETLILVIAMIIFLVVVAYMCAAVLKMVGQAVSYTTTGLAKVVGGPIKTVLESDSLEALRHDDPNFSEPAFREFAGLLFERLHEARGAQNLQTLVPYFDEAVLSQARDTQLTAVSEVLVGALTVASSAGTSRDSHGLTATFEATYTVSRGSSRAEFYAVERWLFSRARTVRSKDPEAMLNLGCPACGNPGEIRKDGVCPYCDQVVNRGNFQWKVVKRNIMQCFPKPPMQLERGGEEVGTDYPTVYPRNFTAQQRAFQGRHPNFDWAALQARVKAIFLQLQEAWSSLQIEKARPFETDVLYDTHRFWIERYKSEGLRNALERVEVRRIVPCRIDFDAYYEILTLRIYASMIDYTVDSHGKVVAGNKDQPRAFSEYWTFLRRVGAGEGRGADLQHCPHCGASMQVSQTGVCEHCQARVTSGQFDWVLSAIDQDEAYGQTPPG